MNTTGINCRIPRSHPLHRRSFLKRAAMVSGMLALARGLPFSSLGQEQTRAGLKDYPFFPFCIDWHDAQKRSFAEQASMLKELGYEGVGHIWLDQVEERIKTLDDAGLKLDRKSVV